jgi:preprotein translocase subunit SecD
MARVVAMLLAVSAFAGCAGSSATAPSVSQGRIQLRFASVAPVRGHKATTNPLDSSTIYLAPGAFLQDEQVQSARVVEVATGEPAVEITFTPAGAATLRDVSERNVGKLVAILVDGRVVTAVPIQSVFDVPSILLVANFTREEAERLARDLSRLAPNPR